MSKRILAVCYTQSGQLGDIIDNLTSPLVEAGHTVERLVLSPAKTFPFPWTSEVFFDAMPESVLMKPAELAPFRLGADHYDLIVIGYQPWFLSPSIPASSFLQHPAFRAVAAGTPVVTVSGGRNMWINAQEKTKTLLREAGARLVGNIALVDRHHNYVSLVTIALWMFSGKKEERWGFLPRPGVSDEDIAHAGVYGRIIAESLETGDWDGLQDRLQRHGAAVINYSLMVIERRAGPIFRRWATFVSGRRNRRFWLVLFKYYLLIALLLVAPVILLVDHLLLRPFTRKRIEQREKYYAGVALAS